MGVYSGIVHDNLLADGGTLNGVTLSGATLSGATLSDATVVASRLWVPTFTAAEIADIADAVNTTAKAAGAMVFDTTNSKLKIATGADANSTWVDADGTNAVTPA